MFEGSAIRICQAGSFFFALKHYTYLQIASAAFMQINMACALRGNFPQQTLDDLERAKCF